MRSPIEIKKNKLLLAEGNDACYFLIWACQAFEVKNIQVLDFGGNSDLRPYLKTLELFPNFENVETIVIARDAENDPEGAIQSIKGAFKAADLPVPDKPFEFAGSLKRVAFMLFPGLDDNLHTTGTLEDLCLEIVKDDITLPCVDQYIDCLKSKGQEIRYLHKSKLHAYLSGKNDFVGLKIGEAAKAGCWNWNHDKLEPFRQIIRNM